MQARRCFSKNILINCPKEAINTQHYVNAKHALLYSNQSYLAARRHSFPRWFIFRLLLNFLAQLF